MTKCALCGYEFDPSQSASACADCGIWKRCGMVRCPRCSYESVATHVAESLTQPPAGGAEETLALTRWPINVKARILKINTSDRQRLRRFIAMGALPGVEIAVIRKFPSYILEIGQGRFSMDEEMAKEITVRGSSRP